MVLEIHIKACVTGPEFFGKKVFGPFFVSRMGKMGKNSLNRSKSRSKIVFSLILLKNVVISFFLIWSTLKVLSWFILLVYINNGCSRSGHGTLKVAVFQEQIDRIN